MSDAKPMPDKIEVEVDDASAGSLARAIFQAATPPDPSLRTGGQNPSQDDNAD